jgi:hypothetical protein
MSDAVPSTPMRRPGRFAAIEREIAATRRQLQELWRSASPADRIFAVDRLLRETILPPQVQQRLQAVQDVVRDAWVTARVANVLKDAVPADARVASLQYSLQERVRDAYLEENRLYDALFLVSEGYLRAEPKAGPSFRDLWRQREVMLAKLVPILPPVEDEAPRAAAPASKDAA